MCFNKEVNCVTPRKIDLNNDLVRMFAFFQMPLIDPIFEPRFFALDAQVEQRDRHEDLLTFGQAIIERVFGRERLLEYLNDDEGTADNILPEETIRNRRPSSEYVLTDDRSDSLSVSSVGRAYQRLVEHSVDWDEEDVLAIRIENRMKRPRKRKKDSDIQKKKRLSSVPVFSELSTCDEEVYNELECEELEPVKKKRRFDESVQAKRPPIFNFNSDESDGCADDEMEEETSENSSSKKGMTNYEKRFPGNLQFIDTFLERKCHIFNTNRDHIKYNGALDAAAVYDSKDIRVSNVSKLGSHRLSLIKKGSCSDKILGLKIRSKKSIQRNVLDHYILSELKMPEEEFIKNFEMDDDEFQYKRTWKKLLYAIDSYRESPWRKFKVAARFFTDADPPMHFEMKYIVRRSINEMKLEPGPLTKKHWSMLDYVCTNRNILPMISDLVYVNTKINSKEELLMSSYLMQFDKKLLYRILFTTDGIASVREERTLIMNEIQEVLLTWSRSLRHDRKQVWEILKYYTFYHEMREGLMIECKPLTLQLIYQ